MEVAGGGGNFDWPPEVEAYGGGGLQESDGTKRWKDIIRRDEREAMRVCINYYYLLSLFS